MKRWLQNYWPYIVVALAIFAPLLGPGFILTSDLVFTPRLHVPDGLTNDYPFFWMLYVLNMMIPSEVIEKLLLVGIVLLAAIGAHRLVTWLQSKQTAAGQWGLYAAGIFYAVNPYTYSRFMAGQYLVLFGYALLPWCLQQLLQFVRTPGLAGSLKLAGLAVIVGVVSMHTLGLLAVLSVSVLLAALWPGSGLTTASRRSILRYSTLALLGFLLISSYWLVPTALGQGTAAQTIQDFDSTHINAFATEGDNVFAKIGNVLRLQGFWMERHGLYTLPQDQLPGWGTVRLLIWVLVVIGLGALWRQRRSMAIMLLAIGGVGLLLSIGVGQPLLATVGYREPHKFAGLVALVFAVSIGYGVGWALTRLHQKSNRWYGTAATSTLVVVLLFTPTMYWGFAGQLKPHRYPPDWFALNQRLNRQPSDYKTLFLPWHQYMSFDFADRIIANPAERFFDQPVLVSNNPELEHIKQPNYNPLLAQLSTLLAAAPTRHDLGQRLAAHHIRFIILAKEYDYRRYAYLDQQPDLKVVWATDGLTLYQNMAVKGDE